MNVLVEISSSGTKSMGVHNRYISRNDKAHIQIVSVIDKESPAHEVRGVGELIVRERGCAPQGLV